MDNKTIETIIITNDYELLQILLHGFQMYYIPFLVYLGSLGNCLSVCVFFGTKMRRTSSNFYLAALAISDTGFLLSLFVVWLGMVEVKLFDRQGFCQFFVYLTTVCSFLSAWFVVSFTVERFVAVRYPLKRQWMCTVKRAKIIIISITSVGLMICSPVLLFSKPQATNSFLNSTMCTLAEEWQKWASAYNVIDTVLTFVIPFCLIVILNTLIVKSVWRIVRVRKTLTTESVNQQRDRDRPNSSQIPRGPISQTKVTKMLLIVSSVFLCFNLPAYVIRIYSYFLIQVIITIIFVQSFIVGVNFFKFFNLFSLFLILYFIYG